MRKLNIQSILLFGFSFIGLVVLSSGIRELVVLNKLNNLRSVEVKIDKTQNLLSETNIMFRSDMSILNLIMSSKEKMVFESLKTEHDNQKMLIADKFRNLSQNLITKEQYFYQEELSEIKELLLETESLYNNDFLALYSQIISSKVNLINIDDYYFEQYNLNNPISKDRILQNLSDELLSFNDQIKSISELIEQKRYLAEQKSTGINIEVEEKINAGYKKANNIAIVFVSLIIVFLIFILSVSIRTILRPISKLQQHLDFLTLGILPDKIETSGGIEIKKMSNALNKIVSGLKSGVEFSLEIGKGHFEATHTPLSEKDVLGNSLLTLRENLKVAQDEDEKRKKEDTQRNRTNEGLTMFSEILRQQTENITVLADDIISSLVKFMKANQGGLFFLNEDDIQNVYYELIGAYAYDRKKYLSKNIKPGEGLVGSVALEKYTIYMTDVPEEYIEIESGVGSANPRSILIVPLQIEDEVLGVIELASFNTLEEYEIEMVEKIADSIAGSLANARINMQTASLLERSKDQEKLMIEQEKELEQNLDEMKKLTNRIYELEAEMEQLKKQKVE